MIHIHTFLKSISKNDKNKHWQSFLLSAISIKNDLVNHPIKHGKSAKYLLIIFLNTNEWGFAILCCAHMPRKIPKQRGGMNFVDPEISIYLGLG